MGVYPRPGVNRRLVESPVIFFHESRISRLRWECTIARQQWPKSTGKARLGAREGRDRFHLTLLIDRSNVNCAMISYGADLQTYRNSLVRILGTFGVKMNEVVSCI